MDKAIEILKLLKKDYLTIQEGERLIAGLMKYVNKYKGETEKSTKEVKQALSNALEYLEEEHTKLKEDVKLEANKKVIRLENKVQEVLNQALDALEAINNVEVKDGNDGYTPIKGVDYNDGKDGSPDTAEQVRDKLELLQEDERLDASAIKGLDFIKQPDLDRAISILDQRTQFLINKQTTTSSSGSGTGTVNSVVAGTGISVDSTDPANPIVSTTITQYTDELAQDAVGGILANSTFVSLAYNDGTPSITGSLSATGTPDNTTYLRGDNTWATIAGGGDVSKVGTPANNQMAVWTGDGTLEGTSDFTYDGTSLNLITGKNFQIAGGTVLADAAGTLTLSGIDAIDATTEATIEAAIDTLANLTSIQGRTVTLADAGANAIFGWDDVAGAYENLTQAEARTVLGLGTAAYVATDLADLNEATIEGAIDTLANLTSVQGRTIALADAGADAIFGWDDSASQYANLSGADAILALGVTASATELNYTDGVTSAIQTQIDSKAAHATTITIAGTANQITSSAGAQDLSANRTWTLSLPADVIIPTVLTVPNTGLHLLDSNASHDLIIKPGSNLTADKTLTLTTGDADVILDLTAVTDEYVLAYDTGTNTWRGVASSGGTPTVITVANEATDTSCFPLFVTAATGDLGPKTNAGLAFNSNTAVLTATGFSGPLTGNVTGNVSGTAATVTGAAQTAITSVGTLTALDVDNININGNTISSTAGTDLLITPLAGQQIVLDGTIEIDAGVVTGATSISSTTFVGALTGNASTATALATGRTIGGVTFDGTANIVPQTIQSVNEATDTTCFPLFISASGSQSLQPLNNTSFTFNSNTAQLGATTFNAGTGFQIGGAAASGKILKANGTNFVASTETYAAPGTSGNVMTSDGTNWTSAAPSGASFSPYYQTATDFGDTNRFNQNVSGSGANTFAAFGVRISTGATGNSYADVQWYVTPAVQGRIFDGSPQFSCSLNIRNAPTNQPNTGTFYIGLGLLGYTGTSIDFTGRHIGFKLVVTGADTYSLYATQGDGSTETASSALTTVSDTPNSLELCIKVNALASVDYYWRKDGGAWSSATNLTTNLPTTGDTGRVAHFLGINQNTANNNEIEVSGASYRR